MPRTLSLFSGNVAATTYVYNDSGSARAYVAGTPVAGTLLAEFTCAPASLVRAVQGGTPNAVVQWEPWSAASASAFASQVIDAPWTCIRLTGTNANVNIAGGDE